MGDASKFPRTSQGRGEEEDKELWKEKCGQMLGETACLPMKGDKGRIIAQLEGGNEMHGLVGR